MGWSDGRKRNCGEGRGVGIMEVRKGRVGSVNE